MRIIKTHEMQPSDLRTQWERDQVYNGLDCCVTAEVLDELLPQLDEQTARTYAFSKALQGPVLEMRLRGLLVDQQRKAEVIDEYFETLERLERNLERIVLEGVGLPHFNWRSNADLHTLFYDKLGIPVVKKQGRPTVNREALEKMEAYIIARPIVSHMKAMRQLGKRISVLKTEIDHDGRMRTSYNIAGTNTGRFSSSFSEFGTGGNLQNVEESLRSIFIADKGMKLAKFDAKSGESYCVGAIEWNLFQDGRYLDACETGDPHTATARICWPDLPWTGDLKRDKDIAEQPYYRHYTYRFMCKKLGHGCLTDDHEVLTKEGWVPITKKPLEILVWHDAVSEFDVVQDWTDFIYTNELHSYEGNSISALMTREHRVPYKADSRQPTVKERRADNGPGHKMPLGNDYIGGTVVVPSRLIAAFMADGYQDGYGITFHFKKERKIERLTALCELYGVVLNQYSSSDGSIKLLAKIAGLPKRPGPFMFDWTEECLRDFIDELKHWDGHIAPTAVSISSTKREDLEWFQTFGRILGIGGQISGPYISGFGSVVYRLQQNNRKWASGESIEWTVKEKSDVRVLCPTVKSGWFYVRRNGKIFVTGNSNYGGKADTLSKEAKVPVQMVVEFQPKYWRAYPAHSRWQQWVANEIRRAGVLVSLTGRKRHFWGRRNEDQTLRDALAYDPQGSLADIVNSAMLKVWRLRTADVWMQDHDALTFQFPEEQEYELIPKLLEQLKHPIQLANGRTLLIPYDAKTGWNRGDWNAKTNPDGLKDWKPADGRSRRPKVSIMDRKLR